MQQCIDIVSAGIAESIGIERKVGALAGRQMAGKQILQLPGWFQNSHLQEFRRGVVMCV